MVEAENTLENAEATLTNLGRQPRPVRTRHCRARRPRAFELLHPRAGASGNAAADPGRRAFPVTRTPTRHRCRRTHDGFGQRADRDRPGGPIIPTLNLGGDRGQEAQTFGKLFNAANRLWSIGPSVSRDDL